jgi:tRNA (cmo5U34)-methyltransferase
MLDEHLLSSTGLTAENIKSYIALHSGVDEITCLLPKDDQSAGQLLKENDFRYAGKRLAEGKIVLVFKWFRGLDKGCEDMRSFFNRRARDYDLHMQDDTDAYEMTFCSLFQDMPVTSERIVVLDLGCGTGAELKYVFKKAPNANIVGMDVSEQMLLKLRENYRDFTDNIKTIPSTYLGIDFGENSFEYVVACSTLHHLLPEDKLRLYANIKRGLKNKGCLLISDYLAMSLQEEDSLRETYLELIKKGSIDKNEIYHIDVPLTLEHEMELLETAGFALNRHERIGEKGVIISARVFK